MRVAGSAVLLALVVPVGATNPSLVHATTPYLDATFNVDAQRDVTFGTAVNVDGVPMTLTLDLYTPRGDASAKRPVFVFAHGGFFAFGDKSEGSGWGNRLAQRGYVVASVNYRLSSTPVVAPVDSDRELQEIDDARADMQTAVRWMRVNAASLRIDPDKIAVGGVSAGAVTALGLAVNNDDPEVALYQGVSSAVCTAVSYAGANDPLLVDAGDAGAIFHHGTLDTIVPYDLAVQTRDAMSAAGLPLQWNEYAGDGHSLSAGSQTLADARTIQWLADRVANASYPCSPAVAHRPRVPAGRQTPITGEPGRSAVVSLIAVDATAPGYAQLLACGTPPGASSNLNLDRPGQTRNVLAVVHFDASGRACVFNQPRSHLVVDQHGTFAPGSFDDIDDVRVLDTRSGPRLPAGTQTQILGRPNSTAVASLIATDDTAAGYVQVLACGATPGGSSNVNVDTPHQTRAGLAFIRFDDAGRACLYNQSPTHLIVDIQGYLSSDAFDDGVDTRVLDTRSAPRWCPWRPRIRRRPDTCRRWHAEPRPARRPT